MNAPNKTLRMLPARLASNETLAPWTVLSLSAIFHLAYWADALRLPFLAGPIFDSPVYIRQAESILSGRYGDPSLLAFSPLYGWFLALLMWLGSSPIVIAFTQALLGTWTATLIFACARRVFSLRAAWIAWALFQGYGMTMFYESKLMSDTLGLMLLGLHTYGYHSEGFARGRWPTTWMNGIVCGLAVLSRASLIFCIPFFVIAAFFPSNKSLALTVKRAAGFMMGLACILSLNACWNYLHTRLVVPVILVSSSLDRSNGTHASTHQLNKFSQRASGDVSAWDVVEEAAQKIDGRSHADPEPGVNIFLRPQFWRALPERFVRTFSDTESSFDYGYYGERSEISTLNKLPVSFGFLALCGLLGFGLLVSRKAYSTFVSWLPIVLGVTATCVLYYPSSRYRLPIAIPFAVMGGYLLDALMSDRAIAWQRSAMLCLLLIGAIFSIKLYRYKLRSPGMWELRVAESAIAAGDIENARARIKKAKALEPDSQAIMHRIQLLTAHAMSP